MADKYQNKYRHSIHPFAIVGLPFDFAQDSMQRISLPFVRQNGNIIMDK